MTYIYDILLNFNTDFYEFYEWEKSDTIYHVKRIPVFKVASVVIEDFLTKKIVIDDPFVISITNKTEIYEAKKVKNLKYAAIITDSYRVLGILLDENYRLIKVSDLLLDEALEAIEISNRCTFLNLAYNIVGTKKNNNFLTRGEVKIKKALLSEFKSAYKTKDRLKLEYMYLEYFRESSSDIEEIYQKLVASLGEELSEKHKKLYDLIKLANDKNRLKNLTN